MSDTIDWVARTKPRGVRGILLVFSILIALAVLGSRAAISYWVDLLWFRSLGYESVFWKTRTLEWGMYVFFAALTFAVLYWTLAAFQRSHSLDVPDTHKIFLSGRTFALPISRVLHFGAILVALLIAGLTAAAMESAWPTLALFFYTPRSVGGSVDPIFGRPLNFFLFTLPAWQLIVGWLMTLAILVCVAAVLFRIISGGSRALNQNSLRWSSRSSWRGASVGFGFLLLTLALHQLIGRYELLFEHHTVFDGVDYTGAHVTLIAMQFESAALFLGAVIAIAGGLLRPSRLWLITAVVPIALCYPVASVIGWYVNTFQVKPNQLDRERPYIAYNIAFTRQAYALDRFSQHEFPAETTLGAADPGNNQATLDNIRLWDVQALKDTLRQVQEIRTYYDFTDIDIDRYVVDGSLREVMLAARELNIDKLPESSRNWINDRLIYTHGYGITMNPVNGFTQEGLPALYLSNMPVQSTVHSITVTQPQIYFGELTNTDVYVKTRQQEFNYPEGQTNNLSTYAGTGGIVLGGFLRRMLIAFDRGDLTKLPFSDDITAESRLLMRRSLRDRVEMLAPFLAFDEDPYIVVGDDGRLYWMMDAFTTSDTYPYSAQTSVHDQSLNYMRNSVKVVVDAYNGTTTFYTFDPTDPILAAWRGIYPSMFQDASAMPAWLRKHVRYPELLLGLQAEIYGLYHVTDPEVFYNREDQWTVATQTGSSDQGEQTTQTMEPNFVLMKLPGENSLELVEILPFTPINRNNMIGWVAARSDGDHYGTVAVYDFPKTRLVDGPQQIEARIDQDAQLSGQLTLWNQQGSRVRRGSLLVIPCGKALLYAEPIYLQAARSPMPELRLIVLALQDRLAYGPNFETALASLFGSGESSLMNDSSARAQSTTGGGAQPPTDLNTLITQASRDFSEYQQLTSEGKLSEAGQKLDDLKRVLDELSAHAK